MTRFLVFVFSVGLALASPASAQQQVFIQIEAQPSLAQAQRSLQGYAERFGDLNGFALRTGWFGIALGPYPEEDASTILNNLREARLIPRDSYIAQESDFRAQFWPDGVTRLPRAPSPEPQQDALPQLDEGEDFQPRETLREARAAEARLTREERAELQQALAWAGFYAGGIDAAFGPGTRNAMSRWQEAQAFAATGVLTTRQRNALLRAYNAPLEGLDLAPVEDDAAGIAMTLPTGAVAFARHEAPFSQYEAVGDLDVSVLLISQSGNRATLASLYEVLQTLDIVPLSGPRDLRADAFTITGQNNRYATYIEAALKDGAIKGFALVWPARDEARRQRVLKTMQDSFTRLDNVLAPGAGSATAPSMDLLAGLEIRQPVRTRSGFFIDQRGWVATSADAVSGCTRITLDGSTQASVSAVDSAAGIALLQPAEVLAPRQIAAFAPQPPRLRSEVAVAGYSYGGVLGAPSVTFGTLADLAGLEGESGLARLTLTALESDAGGPVLDDTGAVMGLLLPKETGARVLPDDVSFTARSDLIRGMLTEAGINPDVAPGGTALPPETLRQQAARMTVLVSCWE